MHWFLSELLSDSSSQPYFNVTKSDNPNKDKDKLQMKIQIHSVKKRSLQQQALNIIHSKCRLSEHKNTPEAVERF